MNPWKLWELARDIGLTGLGAWIIWTQVYAPHPSDVLLAIALGLTVPAAASNVRAVLTRGTGESSEHAPSSGEPDSQPSSSPGGGAGEHP